MYKLKLHRTLDSRKWKKFSCGQQLLMIANELNRAKNLLRNHYFLEVRNCYDRAFELLDLTISVTKKTTKLRELIRLRELLGVQYLANSEKMDNNLLRTLLSLDRESYTLLATS